MSTPSKQLRDRRPHHVRWAEYEDGKREIADTAKSSAEYESRLLALTERLGL